MDVLEIASTLARMMYTEEFCSNCGRVIRTDEAKANVAADNEKTAGQFVHGDCSRGQTTEKTWAFQQNQA